MKMSELIAALQAFSREFEDVDVELTEDATSGGISTLDIGPSPVDGRDVLLIE